MTIEHHPFPAFSPNHPKYLLLGSFPPIKLTEKVESEFGIPDQYYAAHNNERNGRDIAFFYGSSDNLLWKLWSEVFDIQLTSKSRIEDFLEPRGIAVTDVHQRIKRRLVGGKISSSDSGICELEGRPIPQEVIDSIQYVISTSKYVTDIFHLRHPQFTGEVLTLPSPSRSGSRAIGRQGDYKEMVKRGTVTDTYEYRLMMYREIFEKIGLL